MPNFPRSNISFSQLPLSTYFYRTYLSSLRGRCSVWCVSRLVPFAQSDAVRPSWLCVAGATLCQSQLRLVSSAQFCASELLFVWQAKRFLPVSFPSFHLCGICSAWESWAAFLIVKLRCFHWALSNNFSNIKLCQPSLFCSTYLSQIHLSNSTQQTCLYQVWLRHTFCQTSLCQTSTSSFSLQTDLTSGISMKLISANLYQSSSISPSKLPVSNWTRIIQCNLHQPCLSSAYPCQTCPLKLHSVKLTCIKLTFTVYRTYLQQTLPFVWCPSNTHFHQTNIRKFTSIKLTSFKVSCIELALPNFSLAHLTIKFTHIKLKLLYVKLNSAQFCPSNFIYQTCRLRTSLHPACPSLDASFICVLFSLTCYNLQHIPLPNLHCAISLPSIFVYRQNEQVGLSGHFVLWWPLLYYFISWPFFIVVAICTIPKTHLFFWMFNWAVKIINGFPSIHGHQIPRNNPVWLFLRLAEGSLEVKLPTTWTDGKAEVWRVKEEKKRSEKIREEKEREERRCRCTKKVGKSRLTLFFQWFVTREGQKVGLLKRWVRSHLARWEMKKCTPLWREAHFEVKMHKAPQLRSTFRSWDVEKVRAVVARSTFRSQKCKKLTGKEHFWTFRCGKSVCRCGAKHIPSQKCKKLTGSGHFLTFRCRKMCANA